MNLYSMKDTITDYCWATCIRDAMEKFSKYLIKDMGDRMEYTVYSCVPDWDHSCVLLDYFDHENNRHNILHMKVREMKPTSKVFQLGL